jgi:alkylated DNA repair dioxygenase AlkB
MASRAKPITPDQLNLWDAAGVQALRPLPMPNADVRYAPAFLDATEAAALFETLRRDVPWEGSQMTMYDRVIDIPRLMAWYDFDRPAPWGAPLEQLKSRIEAAAGAEFGAVRMILYRDGRDSLAWHADREAFDGPRPIVASLTLGATRRFLFRPKPGRPGKGTRKGSEPSGPLRGPLGDRLTLELPSGSLLVMAEGTQENWEHAVPKTTKPVGERINVTFRMHPRTDRG